MKLCFATNNQHKLDEVRQLLGNSFQVSSLADIGCNEELPEEHDTLEANSLQKAKFVFDRYGISCFADDTGLEVEALNGAPGVYSARYAGEQRNSEDNIDLLLKSLEGKTNRTGRFRTVVTLVLNGDVHQFEGIAKGEILNSRRGKGGFGYDPIFRPAETSKSMAELTADEKNAISHRGDAIKKLVAFLKHGKPFTIGVAGGSGSGKTHFIKSLSSNFKSEEICLLSMDHYYKPIDQQQKDKNGVVNFDLPEAINRVAFKNDLIKLQDGQSVDKLEYTFNNPEASQSILTFNPAPILLVEGLFVQYFQEIEALLDLKIFIEAEDQTKLSRRIKRDKEERGYEREDVIYRYQQHAGPVFEQLIAPLKSKADFIIYNNNDFMAAVDVVTTFLQKKLSGIGY